MRSRFKITLQIKEKVAYVYNEDVWYYCRSCLEKKGYHNKMFKIKKSTGSIIEIKCHRCGSIETIEI